MTGVQTCALPICFPVTIFGVWILTARNESDNEAVYSTAEKLGIPKSRIVFTNGKDKWSFVMRHKIDEHVDNNQEQIDKIKKNTLAKGTLFVDN